ncbi:MAG: FG-GAP-like repeat-containing protein [Candidatus Anammoxibacter sp.]
MSFNTIKQTQQKIFDLAQNDYGMKILGTKNSPPGVFFFNDTVEIGSQTGFAVVSADVNGDSIDDLIIGAPNSEGPFERSYKSSGWVYIFFGKKSTAIAELSVKNADVKMFGEKLNRGALLGSSLAAADINGDGIEDVIIGAPRGNVPRSRRYNINNKRLDAGIIYVVFGSKSLPGIINLSKKADITFFGAGQGDLCGYAIATGDINGDGVADVLLGAPEGDGYKDKHKDTGEVYLIYGRKRFPKKIDLAKSWGTKLYGYAGTAKTGFFKNNFPGRAGFALSSADLNGDGFDDIIIASPFSDGLHNERRDAGVVSVIFGKKVLPKRIRLSHKADVTILGARKEDYAGYSLATGDINGDGKYDIIIGAPSGPNEADPYGDKIGWIYGIFGRSQFPEKIDLKKKVDLIIKGNYSIMSGKFGSMFSIEQAAGYPGHTLSSGDVNGDGIDDIIIGKPSAFVLSRYERGVGEVYIIYGNKSLKGRHRLRQKANISIFGVARRDSTGSALSTGDVNGDGVADIIIGAPGAKAKGFGKSRRIGKVYVIYGMKEQ